MAVTKTIIKTTHQDAIVKVAGTAGSATISLASDLLPAAGQELDGATQTVEIVGAVVTGLLGNSVTVTRNGVNILTFAGENSATFDFQGQGFRDPIESTKDIVVAIAGAEGQIYLKLRKISGYANQVENATYGAYDDPARVGASTTHSGSPDKV